MRIAVLVIALCLTLIVGLQSCTVLVSGNMAQRPDVASGGSMGLLLAILFIAGAGFVMALPRVSVVLFGVAMLVGFAAAQATPFSDMNIWALVAAGLGLMSYFGHEELIKKNTKVKQDQNG